MGVNGKKNPEKPEDDGSKSKKFESLAKTLVLAVSKQNAYPSYMIKGL